MKEEAAIYFQQTALIDERSLHERTARIPVHEKENDFQYKIHSHSRSHAFSYIYDRGETYLRLAIYPSASKK